MRNKRNPMNTKFDAHEVENSVFLRKSGYLEILFKYHLIYTKNRSNQGRRIYIRIINKKPFSCICIHDYKTSTPESVRVNSEMKRLF